MDLAIPIFGFLPLLALAAWVYKMFFQRQSEKTGFVAHVACANPPDTLRCIVPMSSPVPSSFLNPVDAGSIPQRPLLVGREEPHAI